MSDALHIRMFYSPIAAIKKLMSKHQGEEKKRAIPVQDPGIMADLRLAVDLAQEAESFIHTKYHGVLIEFLELRATKLYAAFEKDEIDRATYFKSAELLKDIAEHPFRLIRGGQVAAAKISEWDQQGLTSMVADADASLSQGEHHVG